MESALLQKRSSILGKDGLLKDLPGYKACEQVGLDEDEESKEEVCSTDCAFERALSGFEFVNGDEIEFLLGRSDGAKISEERCKYLDSIDTVRREDAVAAFYRFVETIKQKIQEAKLSYEVMSMVHRAKFLAYANSVFADDAENKKKIVDEVESLMVKRRYELSVLSVWQDWLEGELVSASQLRGGDESDRASFIEGVESCPYYNQETVTQKLLFYPTRDVSRNEKIKALQEELAQAIKRLRHPGGC